MPSDIQTRIAQGTKTLEEIKAKHLRIQFALENTEAAAKEMAAKAKAYGANSPEELMALAEAQAAKEVAAVDEFEKNLAATKTVLDEIETGIKNVG